MSLDSQRARLSIDVPRKIRGWRQAGLPLPSAVTGILRTIKREMVVGAIGTLGSSDLLAVERKLRASLGV